ncbi:MAG: GntR family transcriptional repressor for pyruvate dehydrogenase complex, partial [Polaromonas sp.]
EAMQPLMNMITFTARSRAEIVALHSGVLDAVEAGDGVTVCDYLDRLEAYTKTLGHQVMAARRESTSNS